MKKCLKSTVYCSNPMHNGDPTDGFLPIQQDQVYFLDINNNGLKLGVNPNQKSVEFWSLVEKQIHQINQNMQNTREEL